MQNGKKSKLGSILLGIGAVCVVLRLVTKGPGWTLGAVVFLLVGAIVDGASRKRYQREVRGPLVQEAVEAVFPGGKLYAGFRHRVYRRTGGGYRDRGRI